MAGEAIQEELDFYQDSSFANLIISSKVEQRWRRSEEETLV